MSKENANEKITEQITKMLEGGTIPWRKPWNTNGGPTSLSTGKNYRGINVMILGVTALIEEYTSPFWGTYKQITDRGGQVQKGQKSTPVTLWKPFEKNVTDQLTGKEERKKMFFMTTFNVFNADQSDWAQGEKPEVPGMVEHNPIEDADTVVKRYLEGGPKFSHGGDRAFYSPSMDAVRMPEMGSFGQVEQYYSTLFHELTHSTGHASRLAREGVTEGHRFGDADYSREELIAEMGAAFLCAEVGIDPDATMENSAAYIKHWLDALKGDPTMIVQSAGKAQKATDYVLGNVEEVKQEVAA